MWGSTHLVNPPPNIHPPAQVEVLALMSLQQLCSEARSGVLDFQTERTRPSLSSSLAAAGGGRHRPHRHAWRTTRTAQVGQTSLALSLSSEFVWSESLVCAATEQLV